VDKPILTLIRNQAAKRAVAARSTFFRKVYGVTIGDDCAISLSAKLDKTHPRGIVIGDHTRITYGASVMSHNFINGTHHTTTIGSYCFIGAHSIIMPGVTIGDHCIIGALSVVSRDIPAGSVVAGNPAKVIETEVITGRWGVRGGDDAPVLPEGMTTSGRRLTAEEKAEQER
jgi:acetyltransferase-like isoleucine patch superfamily enzyme